MTPQPPTIAHIKSHGLEGLFVTCANAACQRSTPFTFVALGLEDEFPVPGDRAMPALRLYAVRRQDGERHAGLAHA